MKRLIPAAVAVAVAVACVSDQVRRASEVVEVVGGEPTVGQGLPHVSRGDGGMDASFGPVAPFQVDAFSQQQVERVDILWVIDNGAGMKAKQDRVKQNFVSFMQFLTQQQIDFHLGVVSTDVYDPKQSGHLIDAGLPQPWIDANTPNAQAVFVQSASLGGNGSGDEKGLLGGMLALTPPLSPTVPALGGNNCATGSDGGVGCFLRPEAALYTIVLSDSNDNSCSPVLDIDGCDEGQISFTGGYGSTDYWSRFYKGVKGPGGTSKLAAITGTSNDTLYCDQAFAGFCDAFLNASGSNACAGTHPFCTGGPSSDPCCQALSSCYASFVEKSVETFCRFTVVSDGAGHTVSPYYRIRGQWNGCASFDPADGGIQFTATYGSRYLATAQATGGVASSICDQDYTPALAQLGLQASGLRSDFPLSRAPIETSLSVLVTPPGSSTPAQVLPGPSTWSYVRCSGSTPTNVVRFTNAARPLPGAQIAISYDVNVRGLGTCP